MKKKRKILVLAIMMSTIFIITTIVSFTKGNELIREGYLQSEGESAENFAALTASTIRMTDAEVTALKKLTYSELQESEQNLYLKNLMTNTHFAHKIDFAYVMVHLEKDEVKYQITEEIKDLYDEPVGTDMDIMWLLDVTVSDEAPDLVAAADYGRYACYNPYDEEIFRDAPTFRYIESGWGDHICGYAPLYSAEGTYIGVVGVELQTSNFEAYQNMAMWAMALPMIISIVVLLTLFLVLYRQYQKIQFERIYTDALTQVYNRSYYNNQLIKKMNAERKREPVLALMICDIDWFKKVNDTFGHEVGDHVLQEVAEILTATFGAAHVCRFGGEEFVAMIWLKDEDAVEEKIKELFEAIRAHRFTSQEIDVTISLGCSYCSKVERIDGWLLSGMLKAADRSLYNIKEHGRNNYEIAAFTAEQD